MLSRARIGPLHAGWRGALERVLRQLPPLQYPQSKCQAVVLADLQNGMLLHTAAQQHGTLQWAWQPVGFLRKRDAMT